MSKLQRLTAEVLILLIGVLGVSTAKALDVTVPLGGNIQTAINQVNAAGGGSVILQTGTYTITAPLNIKSFVTLMGQGPSSTTITNSRATNVIQQASEGLANVTIANLRVTGRQTNACFGILIQAFSTYHTNITLTNVEVAYSGMGVHLKRVCGVNVADCNFHHNGTTFASDLGYFHNLYIRQCDDTNYNVTVTNCQLNNGLSGNGLNLSYNANIFVTHSTATNNWFRGVRAADSVGFTVWNCTLSGNGDAGLIANTEINPTQNINWYANAAHDNLNGGFTTVSGVTGSAVNNDACGNTPANYSFNGSIIRSGNTTCGNVPAAPTGLAATAGSAQVNLRWETVTGAISYNVKRSIASGGPYTSTVSAITTTNYTDVGLTNGTSYFYTISANNVVGESANSAEVCARPVSMSPPQIIASVTASQLQLSWPSANTGWRLQINSNLAGTNWSDVSGGNATNLMLISPATSNAFFRLIYP